MHLFYEFCKFNTSFYKINILALNGGFKNTRLASYVIVYIT